MEDAKRTFPALGRLVDEDYQLRERNQQNLLTFLSFYITINLFNGEQFEVKQSNSEQFI